METASCAWKGVVFEAWGESEIFNQYCSHVQWGVMNEAIYNQSFSFIKIQFKSNLNSRQPNEIQ